MPGLTILKFGGSVLRQESDLRLAVHEIYRHVRGGSKVIAVTSAFEGVTDELLERARAYSPGQDDAACTLAATGELTTASLLALALRSAGIPAGLLTPQQVHLRAEGDAADAHPVAVNGDAILGALRGAPVAVIPGFVAIDDRGAFTLLGRGGSDLTALFLAAELGASRCLLIKDVDGLYERDPALAGPPPRRYQQISFDDALLLDGGIVQHKAVRLAQRRRLSFEVGALAREYSTRVGEGRTVHASPTTPDRRLRITLLGAGTVGGGVYEHLRRLETLFRVQRIAVRNIDAAVARGLPRDLLTNDALAAAAEPCDIVIELMGGLDPARAAIRAALGQGKHVVTANKRLIAEAGEALTSLAAAHGAQLLYSAAVGGAVPMLEAVRRISRQERILRLEGVVNGTTNYILSRAAEGGEFDAILGEAQRLGIAEADPNADLSGMDAACKLCLLAIAAGERLTIQRVDREALSAEVAAKLLGRRAGLCGAFVPRQVAHLSLEGGPRAGVRLDLLPEDHPLAAARGAENVLLIHCAGGSVHHLRGTGAGRWPTAESVVADLLDLSRGLRAQGPGRRTFTRKGPNIAPFPFDSVPVSGEIPRCEQPNSVPALA